MKKLQLFLSFLFLTLSGFAFAQGFKLYPGLYIGGDFSRPIDDGMFSIGGDIQAGFETGDLDYDTFVVGIFGNIGLDTGRPNAPNFYYGGMAEFYLFGSEVRVGTAVGGGWNTGIAELKNNDRPVRDSFYIRAGIPINIGGGTVKYGLYYDYYFDVGSRLGILFHFGIP
jgi:hypothetical protein